MGTPGQAIKIIQSGREHSVATRTWSQQLVIIL